jgi:S-adenosylmethionine:tRNA ribosyltransferase-isomerase
LPQPSPPTLDDLLDSYRFDLPEDRIADRPCAVRDACRLMVLDRSAGTVAHAVFADLPGLLPPGALLIANDTKSCGAAAREKAHGGAVEFLLLTPVALLTPRIDPQTGWSMARPPDCCASPAARPGDRIDLAPDLFLTVTSRGAFGHTEVTLSWQGELPAILSRIGHVPLPPYIRRPDDADDRQTYQTV